MWCVIPVAGGATRLRSILGDRPKALIEVGGRSLIEHLLDLLVDAVSDVCLVTTPEAAHVFEDSLGSRRAGLRLHYAAQDAPLGVAHAVRQSSDRVRGPFVVLMGDCYYDGELTPLVAGWKESGDQGGVLVEPATEAGGQPMGLVSVSEGRIDRIYKAPWTGQTAWRVAGAYLFPDSYFQVAATLAPADSGEYELEDVVTRMLDHGARFTAVPFEGWRRNVNTPGDLAAVERRIAAGPISSSGP
jgi:glucose-1-phosphate thymidylyltransferase